MRRDRYSPRRLTRVRIRYALCGIAFLSAVACASGGAAAEPDASSPIRTATRADPYVLSEDELGESSVGDIDALAVIKRLRPAFLVTRGRASASNASAGSVHVSVDGGPLRGTDALTSIRATEIGEIRYLSTTAAAQRYGSLAGAGPVILIRRK